MNFLNFRKNINKRIRLQHIVLFTIIFLLSFILYTEFLYKKNEFMKEKIYDLQVQYSEKTLSNKKYADTLYDEVLDHSEIITLLDDANSNINKDINRKKLYKLLKAKYERMRQKGVLQLHFHLADGESFLRFHKIGTYGDSLLFRKSIRDVIKQKKVIYGFEIGKYFGGFRYVYPIFNVSGKYIGSVETSIGTQSVIDEMDSSLKAKHYIILKKDAVSKVVSQQNIQKHYKPFYFDDEYYMAAKNHNVETFKDSGLTDIKQDLRSLLKSGKSFSLYGFNDSFKMKIYTFIPIVDISNESVGYIFAIKNDNTIFEMFMSQFIKFLFAIFVTCLIYYFYQRNRQQVNTIAQLQNAIDQTTLVSKTDLTGKITYANDAFVKLSGYSYDELIGKPHNKVRHPDMPSSVFRDLWSTIQSKKIWHGTIKNMRKDGGSYTVDATILPILDVNKKIKEYIAIRHDITELDAIKEHLSKELKISNKNFAEAYTRAKEYEKAIDDSNIVSRTDLDGNITYVNQYFCDVSGYTQQELIGQKHSIVRHPDEPDSLFKEMWETISSGKTWHGQIKNLSKDGRTYYVESTIVPIFNDNVEIVEYLGIRHDVTEIVNFHRELEETQKEIIYKMGEVGESRSQETGYHVKRVAKYSRLLALLAGLDEKEAELLYMASPMHDIGKVGIPDSILKKPGKLDADEWAVMQTHAEIGYNILNTSTRPILKAAATVSYEHHEKWDGSGYPNKLSEDNIHIYGRITAIADVFDALGSDRCYKKAWEIEQIIELFKEERGKHFDPNLVDLFLENLDQFLVIRDNYIDVPSN